MQKMKLILLLPALFTFPYIISMDGSDSSQFKSFSEDTTSTGNFAPIISYADGTSSGSTGDDDKQPKPQYPAPLQSWHFTMADAFILPASPTPKRPKKPIVPTLNLKSREEILALKKQEERREKIKENFGKKFEQESKKEEEIGAAINVLEQFSLNSAKPRGSSSPITLAPLPTRQTRAISHETPLTRTPSEKNCTDTSSPQIGDTNTFSIAPKIPKITLTPQQSSTPPTPPNSPLRSSTEIVHETPRTIQTPPPTPRDVKKEIPQIPVISPSTPSQESTAPRIEDNKPLTDSSKTSAQEIGIPAKKEDATINNAPEKINPSPMHPLTWKDRRIALLTITGVTMSGLLILLYYLDKLPGSLSAKMDNLLATFRMNR